MIYNNQLLRMVQQNGALAPRSKFWLLFPRCYSNHLEFLIFSKIFEVSVSSYPILHSFSYLTSICKKIDF